MFEYIQRMILIFAIMQPLIACTQDLYLKGKVLAFPVTGISAVALSIGFEKIYQGRHSASAMMHFSQFGSNDYDGSVHSSFKISPEYRYYFKHSKHPASKKYFMGIFTEFTRCVQKYGGEQSGPEINLYTRELSIDPGLIIGKNFKLSSRWHLEMYAGPKCRFVASRTKTINAGNNFYYEDRSIKPGIKTGFNFAFRI